MKNTILFYALSVAMPLFLTGCGITSVGYRETGNIPENAGDFPFPVYVESVEMLEAEEEDQRNNYYFSESRSNQPVKYNTVACDTAAIRTMLVQGNGKMFVADPDKGIPAKITMKKERNASTQKQGPVTVDTISAAYKMEAEICGEKGTCDFQFFNETASALFPLNWFGYPKADDKVTYLSQGENSPMLQDPNQKQNIKYSAFSPADPNTIKLYENCFASIDRKVLMESYKKRVKTINPTEEKPQAVAAKVTDAKATDAKATDAKATDAKTTAAKVESVKETPAIKAPETPVKVPEQVPVVPKLGL